MPYVSVDREIIEQDLRAYGEDALADQIPAITEGQRVAIGWATGRYWDGEVSMVLRKATTLAAVEVLEGAPRELARKRARLSVAPKTS